MPKQRLHSPVMICSILALAASVAVLNPQKASAADEAIGATYVTTVVDANGNFASRGVITLHADRTMAVLDSGQGGPAFSFSSQLGSWKPDGKGGIIASTIDFDFPSEDVARLDYAIKFGKNGTVSGTITLSVFPLQANPLDGGGTVLGTFAFTGQLIQPQ